MFTVCLSHPSVSFCFLNRWLYLQYIEYSYRMNSLNICKIKKNKGKHRVLWKAPGGAPTQPEEQGKASVKRWVLGNKPNKGSKEWKHGNLVKLWVLILKQRVCWWRGEGVWGRKGKRKEIDRIWFIFVHFSWGAFEMWGIVFIPKIKVAGWLHFKVKSLVYSFCGYDGFVVCCLHVHIYFFPPHLIWLGVENAW